jgi:hypothetical protein
MYHFEDLYNLLHELQSFQFLIFVTLYFDFLWLDSQNQTKI